MECATQYRVDMGWLFGSVLELFEYNQLVIENLPCFVSFEGGFLTASQKEEPCLDFAKKGSLVSHHGLLDGLLGARFGEHRVERSCRLQGTDPCSCVEDYPLN